MIHCLQRFSTNSKPFLWNDLILLLKIRPSSRYHYFTVAKSLSLQRSFEVCKQPVVAEGHICRIWTKYLAHPKIRMPKPCLLMFAFSVALNGFHLLLFNQLTADLTPKWSEWYMFHPLVHMYVKKYFCCVETVANNTLNRRRVIVFDRLWANTAPTLNTAFSLTNVHVKWWINCLLISSTPLLSHKTLA